MTPPQAVFHALLRPCILQILRATGFHSARPAVIDSLTDLAARYLELLCEETAHHAATNDNTTLLGDLDPTIVDVRLALQDVGALLPEKSYQEQDFMEVEDMRGVEDFIAWAFGPKSREIKRIALEGVDEEAEATDYLTALKKRHSKTVDDSKYTGTLLGKSNDHGLVLIEGGGELDSIQTWMQSRMKSPSKSSVVEARSPSSRLTSIGTIGEEMDIS